MQLQGERIDRDYLETFDCIAVGYGSCSAETTPTLRKDKRDLKRLRAAL